MVEPHGTDYHRRFVEYSKVNPIPDTLDPDTDENKFVQVINDAIQELKKTYDDSNKNNLFQLLLNLMMYKYGTRWANILKRDKYTQRNGKAILSTRIEILLAQLEIIFYSTSQWIQKDDSKLPTDLYRVYPIPSKLFLEFLLYVARHIVILKNESKLFELYCLGLLARRSDQESVLNTAQEKDRFFLITTEPIETPKIFDEILEIYKECGVTFTGNISISHIIGQLCEGITGTEIDPESSPSPDRPPLELTSPPHQSKLNRYSPTKSSTFKPRGAISKERLPVNDNKPICPHGVDCYRRNPDHLLEFYHPRRRQLAPANTKPPWRPGGGSGKSKHTTRRRPSTKRRTRTTRRRR
jgi:hypothetical protein